LIKTWTVIEIKKTSNLLQVILTYGSSMMGESYTPSALQIRVKNLKQCKEKSEKEKKLNSKTF
jgi:hypothetical protein